MESPTLREIPHNIEAERYVLGAVLVDNACLPEVVQTVTATDFYSPAHAAIFSTMAILFNQGKVVELASLSATLKDGGHIAAIGGTAYIAGLPEDVPSTANVKFYLDILRDKSLRRDLIRAAGQITEISHKEFEEAKLVLDQAQSLIFGIAENRGGRRDFHDPRVLARETYGILEEAVHKQCLPGISTGFIDLDNMLSGLQAGDLVIIAGRPSMGKTALALNVATHCALNLMEPCAFFSLEMMATSLQLRVISARTGISINAIRRGKIGETEWPLITRCMEEIHTMPLYINDLFNISPMEIKAAARRLQAEKGLSLLVVDYIQLIRASKNEHSREREVASISRELKFIAKDLQIPVIALSQLNRSVEKQNDKRPGMADLRESGALEQDADVIAFVYRDEMYNENSAARGTAEIIIAKQRNGATGKVELKYRGDCVRFDNLLKTKSFTD